MTSGSTNMNSTTSSSRLSLFESLYLLFHRQRRLSDRSIYLIFLLLGIGVLTPWNAFISSLVYFQGRICSIPGASQEFESLIGLLFNLSSVSALSLLLAWPWLQRRAACWLRGGTRLPGTTNERTEEISIHSNALALDDPEATQQSAAIAAHKSQNNHKFWLVTVPLTVFLLVFLVTDLLVAIKDISAEFFLFLTLLGMVLCGAGSAFATAGIVATSGNFPPSLGINPFVSGQAVSGVVISLANFFAAVAEDPKDYWKQHCNSTATRFLVDSTVELQEAGNSTTIHAEQETCSSYDKFDTAVFMYFFVGTVVLLSCIIGFQILNNQSPEYETVGSERDTTTSQPETFQDEPSPRSGLELQQSPTIRDNDDESHAGGPLRRMSSVESQSATTVTSEMPTSIFQAIQAPAFSIYFTFLVTLSLFPSWTSRLKSIRQCQTYPSRLSNDLYVPFTFVLFNVGDLGGRAFAGQFDTTKIPNFSTKLVLATLLRCCFFPLLLLCVGGNDPNRLQVHSDFYSLGVQSLFALSNGLFISLGFMHAPNLIPSTAEAQERSSEILTLSLSLGLLCGSLLSFPVAKLTA